MFMCFECIYIYIYIYRSHRNLIIDSLLGYSVTVGDFNDDSEDGKIFNNFDVVDILEIINGWDLLNIVLNKYIILSGKGTLNQSLMMVKTLIMLQNIEKDFCKES